MSTSDQYPTGVPDLGDAPKTLRSNRVLVEWSPPKLDSQRFLRRGWNYTWSFSPLCISKKNARHQEFKDAPTSHLHPFAQLGHWKGTHWGQHFVQMATRQVLQISVGGWEPASSNDAIFHEAGNTERSFREICCAMTSLSLRQRLIKTSKDAKACLVHVPILICKMWTYGRIFAWQDLFHLFHVFFFVLFLSFFFIINFSTFNLWSTFPVTGFGPLFGWALQQRRSLAVLRAPSGSTFPPCRQLHALKQNTRDGFGQSSADASDSPGLRRVHRVQFL